MTDDERNRINNIYHNKSSSKLASRKEVTELVELFIQQLVDGDVEDYRAVAPQVIKEGYRYFMNDLEVTAERFYSITEAQANGELSSEPGDIDMRREG